MSDPLLEEYKAYYRVRAERFAGNDNYRHSYEAESKLSEAMQGCAELIEFKDRIGNLNEKCATALVKDQYLMEQSHFNKHQEVVRVLAAEEVLDRADEQPNVNDLMTMVQDVEQRVGIKISMDEAHRHFQGEWKLMDDLEVYERAVIPDRYKAEYAKFADELRAKIRESANDLESQSGDWEAGWKYEPAKNLEYRHRRLIPYKDEHLNEMLNKYRNLVNR